MSFNQGKAHTNSQAHPAHHQGVNSKKSKAGSSLKKLLAQNCATKVEETMEINK
jgi:hypothetical protein